MKQKILPGAAGLIALTATIGFVGGHREMEIDSFSRNRITLLRVKPENQAVRPPAGDQPEIKPANPAYLVEIRRGSTFAAVKIDAVTGRLLES